MSAESKVVVATGGTLLITIVMLAVFAAADRQDIRAELRFEGARLDQRLLALENRIETRFASLETRFANLETRFADFEKRMDTRFTRIEERMDLVLHAIGRSAPAPALEQSEARPPAPPLEDSEARPPVQASRPSASSVTAVRGTDFVILSSAPVLASGWTKAN